MKPSTILLSAVSYLGLVSGAAIANPDEDLHDLEARACFKTGASFGAQKGAVDNAIVHACSSSLVGKYMKRETRVKCYNIPNNKHVKLTIGLTGKNAGSTRSIGGTECVGGLYSELKNCARGGDTTYGNWRYRVDPNEGLC